MTVKELKAEPVKQGIEIPEGAKKADLEALPNGSSNEPAVSEYVLMRHKNGDAKMVSAGKVGRMSENGFEIVQ